MTEAKKGYKCKYCGGVFEKPLLLVIITGQNISELRKEKGKRYRSKSVRADKQNSRSYWYLERIAGIASFK